MILNILRYGDPLLEKRSKAVDEFDGDLQKLIADMFETMYAARGIGLAAPQVGALKRIFVMDCAAGSDPRQKLVLINPEIVSTEGELIGEEGCLSFPGIYAKISRPKRVVVVALDQQGKDFTLDVTDLAARCVAHETDHLDGELFIDRMSAIKRDFLERKIRKLIKSGEWSSTAPEVAAGGRFVG